MNYEIVSNEVPRVHQFNIENSIVKVSSLTAISETGNRAVASMSFYKRFKNKNPNFNTFDFSVLHYENFFKKK